ncbi:paramyosin-like isoform X2 [Dreissena polymorpha]|uniref:paramyosin-like isoform X2 n=1 Tax=Dreissena polymorpha TaxID=45954 RepID=UPI0022647BFC|nr:paramyosin-like isoform X2 [Dreissena polymorpha]
MSEVLLSRKLHIAIKMSSDLSRPIKPTGRGKINNDQPPLTEKPGSRNSTRKSPSAYAGSDIVEDDIENMQMQLQKVSAEKEKQKEDLDQAKKEVSEIHNKLQIVIHEKEKQQKALDKSTKDLSELQKKLNAAETKIAQREKEFYELQSRSRQAEAECNLHERKLNDLQTKLKTALAECNRGKQEYKDLKAQLQSALTECSRGEKEFRDFKEQTMGCFPSKRCAELERDVDEEKERFIKDKESFIGQVLQAMDSKDEELAQMKKKLEEQERKLDAFYKGSAQIMRESGSQENTNDEFSNTRLAERFDVSLKRKWLDICDALQLIINEIQKLTTLSVIMERVSKHTAHTVNDTEKNLVLLAHYANEDQNEVRHAIQILRQRLGQKKSTREYVVKDIVAKVKEDETVTSILTRNNVPDATVATIERFMYDLADICWLMCIGNPPLKLNFDVKGVDFSKIDNRFVEYAIIENEFSDGKPGAVYLVAWPSLELEDNTGFLKKGEAIVCR